MIWRRLRQLLCRLGVDAACDYDGRELAEREARMLALTWRLEVLAAEQRGQRDGGDD
jgi:hypothetical protein